VARKPLSDADTRDLQDLLQSLREITDRAYERMRSAAEADDMRGLGVALEDCRLGVLAEQRLQRVVNKYFVGARSISGAKARAAELKSKGATTKAKVKALETELIAAGTPRSAITKKIASALDCSVDTVRAHRK
jgi:hypothetical protein